VLDDELIAIVEEAWVAAELVDDEALDPVGVVLS